MREISATLVFLLQGMRKRSGSGSDIPPGVSAGIHGKGCRTLHLSQGAFSRTGTITRTVRLDEQKTPRELSEGMKVKFNLVLALSHRAEVLILDEPTSGLDPFSREELLEIFTMLRDGGTAVFFSTHIVSDLEKCADDILYISRGKIRAAKTKQDFCDAYSHAGESLEDTILRMEKEAVRA